jgi:AcrR family transcriptional regulator
VTSSSRNPPVTSAEIDNKFIYNKMYASNYMHTKRGSPDKTREVILDAALEVFSQGGFAGATTRAISIKAGVNEVTLFRHFGSKKRLFKAVLDRDMDLSDVTADIPEPQGKDPVEDLTRIGMFMAQQMKVRSRVSKLVLTDGPKVGAKDMVKRLPTQGLARITPLFERMGARDPYISAVTFLSFLLRSAIFAQFFGEDPVVKLDEDTIRKLSKTIVEGMR